MSDWLSPELKTAIDALTEAQIVALVLYGEARSEPVQGIVAVGSVIRNRVRKPGWWGAGFSGVCLQPWQFSCLSPKGGEGNYKKVLGFAQRLAKKSQITNALERQCVWVAQGIVGDYVVDPTKASTHYHTKALHPRPEWAMGHTPVLQISAHCFYNDVK
jgi:N-acetylmuramoyl-L-alanine amidase